MPEGSPTVIDREDRLEAELLQTKIQNVQFQLQLMQADLQKALETRNTLINQMTTFREVFQNKYGVDLAKLHINDDGTFKVLPPRS
jgi:hypothetical protein